jgi:uncharacterized protein (TIGR02118 family)
MHLTALYPNPSDRAFDHEFFEKHHVPLVLELLGPYGCSKIEVCRCLPPADASEAGYATIANMYFDAVDGFERGFASHGEQILGDVPKYTSVGPITVISEEAVTIP